MQRSRPPGAGPARSPRSLAAGGASPGSPAARRQGRCRSAPTARCSRATGDDQRQRRPAGARPAATPSAPQRACGAAPGRARTEAGGDRRTRRLVRQPQRGAAERLRQPAAPRRTRSGTEAAERRAGPGSVSTMSGDVNRVRRDRGDACQQRDERAPTAGTAASRTIVKPVSIAPEKGGRPAVRTRRHFAAGRPAPWPRPGTAARIPANAETARRDHVEREGARGVDGDADEGQVVRVGTGDHDAGTGSSRRTPARRARRPATGRRGRRPAAPHRGHAAASRASVLGVQRQGAVGGLDAGQVMLQVHRRRDLVGRQPLPRRPASPSSSSWKAVALASDRCAAPCTSRYASCRSAPLAIMASSSASE